METDRIEWYSEDVLKGWYNEWICYQGDLHSGRPNTLYPFEIPFTMSEIERELCRRRSLNEMSSN